MRGGVILVEHGRVALIERRRAGRVYYLFPGGGVEESESVEEAAIREAYEELGLRVALGSLAAVVEFRGNRQYLFHSHALSGEFGTGKGAELLSLADSEEGTHSPVWIPLAALAELDVRPRLVADAVASGDISGWQGLSVVEP